MDISFAHCHGGGEFEPHHCTFFLCVFFFFFFFFFYQLIYLFIDIHAIHNHFQTNLVAEYRFNDI